MSYCCETFERLAGNSDERGLSFKAIERGGEVRWRIQSRGISVADEKKVSDVSVPFQINVSAELAAKFCPFCGTELARLNISAIHEKC